MKKIIILTILLITASLSYSQVYDGITQPTKYRLWVPVSTTLDGNHKVAVAPFVGYKIDAAKWLSITPVFQYNINADKSIPQIWVNVNYKKKYFLLFRNIYDIKDNKLKETLSGTAKLPKGFMVDFTWDNFYNGSDLLKGDRLQFLGGYAGKKFVLNAGYSIREKPGFISNFRYKVTDYNWIQLKYDSGAKAFTISTALQFN